MTENHLSVYQEVSPLLIYGDWGVNLGYDVITAAPRVQSGRGLLGEHHSGVPYNWRDMDRDTVPLSTSSAGGEFPSETWSVGRSRGGLQ